ncbi:pyridoxal phosphate-dependent decarboxylase family protein [Antarctobacter heliothermus]|uniref:Glutamate or tyrosine decarboxylase n=1 Tax=Antarctobacter heliothermus TaxID=74033 RepID=A0A239J8D2_9RHOB|nr:aminotransferase class V-fold PLP-dependent enzyme [Antarctobacter heliothermus]SNT01523.1 Glutamate or tyrosine decarboxylase [Antarctobacter heliothermus]
MTLTPDESAAIDAAGRMAIAFRDGLGARTVPPALRPDAIAGRFAGALPQGGASAASVIEQLAAEATEGVHGHASPRFFGYVCGGSMPVGVAAETLVSAWGQNSASSWESPAVAAIEEAVCRWCLDLLGLPADSGVGIVTGATIANTQGIMTARHVLLARQGWDVEADGLFGAPEFPVLIGADAHSAPLAGLRYAGLGSKRVVQVGTDDQGRISLAALAESLDRCTTPPLVILQAGQINTGAFDPFAEAIALVHATGGWVHVDGAFGLWLKAAPSLRDRLAGVEDADSWAVDLHKMLSAPFDAGLCIVRDRPALVESMTARGAYLPSLSANWDPSDTTLELSRRARGVASYAILRHLGRQGVEDLMTRLCTLAEHVAARLAAEPGLDVLNDVVSNQVIVALASDDLTDAALAEVQRRGHVYPSHGEWRGRKVIRMSVTNYGTQIADVDLLADEIILAARGLA